MTPDAASTPRAIGRSNEEPALRTSAGARLTMTRWPGNSKPQLRMALLDAVAALADACVRQSDHREARQTERDVDFDRDGDASMPNTAAERMQASMPTGLQNDRTFTDGAFCQGIVRSTRRTAVLYAEGAISLDRRGLSFDTLRLAAHDLLGLVGHFRFRLRLLQVLTVQRVLRRELHGALEGRQRVHGQVLL